MAKSDLQLRAERASERFSINARRPVVIEFSGVPKAGKTSTLTQVQAFLKRCGFRTEIVVERASVCPIRDKKHSNFNVWTVCTTLAQILEKTQDPPRPDDPHLLILDRGIFDSICWMTMMERLARIRNADRELVEKFLRISEWRQRISGVIMMITSPEDSMKREQGHLPIESVTGSIMNKEVLYQIRKINLECAERLKNDFRIFQIDTSFGEAKDNPKRTAEIATDIILSLVEEHVKEEILFLPKNKIKEIFQNNTALQHSESSNLVRLFVNTKVFRPREEVEQDKQLVQALPIVVVRNASGGILLLRRRERSTDNPLHQKILTWAGGHVRREDANNGDPLIQCAIRELKEELRLSIEPRDLQLIGAIYIDDEQRTSQHVAVVYEWRANSDDVAVALSSAEFFERRGTSLSGKFISLQELAADIDSGKISEPWTREIVSQYLAKDSYNFKPKLFQ